MEKAPVIAVLNIVDDDAIIAPDELGLNGQTFAQFGTDEGSAVTRTTNSSN